MSDMHDWSIAILSRHVPQAASSRLRTFQYVPHLEAAGATVSCRPFFDESYLHHLYGQGARRTANVARAYARRFKDVWQTRRFSVAWIEKELFPYLPAGFETALAALKIPYVVDYDDASFHTYDQHRHPLVRHLLSHKLDGLIRNASAVTVGNSYLANYVQSHGARQIHRVPTVVDLNRYTALPPPPQDRLRIGWIGTPATTKYLHLLEEPLRRLLQIRPITLVTIGASTLPSFGVPLEQHPWSADSESALLSSIHVGVMPLPDEPWERGKCGYKLIQYMACARPVVASPVGVNVDIVTPSVGFLARTPADWIQALDTLGSNPAVAEAMGQQGRALVETDYSIQATAPRIVATLKAASMGSAK